jgi:hypothetical protein
MKKLVMLAIAATLPVAAHAQSLEEQATYLATMRTPAGALPPMLTNTLIGRAQVGASLALRYGYLGSGDFNPAMHAVGVTGILPAGLGSLVNVTAGVLADDCDGCNPLLMLGLGGDIRLLGQALGNVATSPMVTVSLDGEIGYSKRDPGSFVSGYVGAPIALVQRGTGLQFVPFLTPGFAIGQLSANGESLNGTGLMVGGGLGIYNPLSGVVVNVGTQHSFMNGARNTLGIDVIIGGR